MLDVTSQGSAGGVPADDREPCLGRAPADRPEAEPTREQSEGERRDSPRAAGERAHQDHASGEAGRDEDHLRRPKRPDQSTSVEWPEAITLILARAHPSPPSSGGPRSGGGSGGRDRRAGGGGGGSGGRGRSAGGGGEGTGRVGGASVAVGDLGCA